MTWFSRHKGAAKSRGQSMLEAIVASGIIVTAVSAALTLVQSSLAGAKSSEEQIVAYTLAQEAIEVVRQIRDSNWLAGRSYDYGLVGPGDVFDSVPVFDPSTATWSLDFGATEWESDKVRVYKQTVINGSAPVGLYRQADSQPDGTEATRFRRKLVLTRLCSLPGEPVDHNDNQIDFELLSSACPVGQNNIGFEVQALIRWDRPSGGFNEVQVVTTMTDWR